MNRQPVTYSQADPRWGALRYAVPGEDSTIRSSGCGPCCAAMLLTTLTGREITPVDTCAWSVAHGYKAAHQGTYHSYFIPQFKAHGILCRQLTSASVYGRPDDPIHRKAMDLLQMGWYLIALMGPGRWTHGGHYIVVWQADERIRINDPASTQDRRLNGDPPVFFQQVKHYWAVDARSHSTAGGEDDMTDEAFAEKMDAYLANLADRPPSPWSAEARQAVERAGLFQGEEDGRMCYQSFVTREKLAVILQRLLPLLKDPPPPK